MFLNFIQEHSEAGQTRRVQAEGTRRMPYMLSSQILEALLKQLSRPAAYVNMLAEGFDCPGIMWICARRKIGSRVRFAQEIGRGLRSYHGKTECLVFDPHRLFQRLSLSYEACLGEIV